MLCGYKNAYDCIKAFSETDLRPDLEQIKMPILILHGDDDQVVPIGASARQAVLLLNYCMLKETTEGPHALHLVRRRR
jgi:non-heme chloroperoxidase